MADQSDPIDPATSLERQRADKDKAVADARRAEFDLQQARLKAALPAPSVTAPDGSTTVGEGVGLIAELVAYEQLMRAARDIVGRLKIPDCGRVLIVEDRALAESCWSFSSCSPELLRHDDALKVLKAEIEEELTKPMPVTPDDLYQPSRRAYARSDRLLRVAGPPLLAAGSVVSTALDLYALFRTDYAISSRQTKIEPTSLVASFVSALLEKEVATVVDAFRTLAGSEIMRRFRETQKLRADVAALCSRLVTERVSVLATAADEFYVDLPDDRGPDHDLKAVAVRLMASHRATQLKDKTNAVLTAYDAFTKAITTSSSETPAPLLLAALREDLFADESPMLVLYVHLDSSGGEVITRKGLFRLPGRVAYIGACTISFILTDPAGEPMTAGTYSYASHVRYVLRSGRLTTLRTTTFGEN